MKCEVEHNGDMGMGHLWLKWLGQLWQKTHASLQGSTLSDHCMTTGFGPFELTTCSLQYSSIPYNQAISRFFVVVVVFPFFQGIYLTTPKGFVLSVIICGT